MTTKDQIETISRGTAEIISPDGLKKKLALSQKKNKKLVIKAGFDPTAPDIHLGHVVLLRKLRQLQNLGHTVYFLIGDFTAQVGDPTGKDQLRPKMDQKAITQNAETYAKQVYKMLDKKKTKVVFNSSWLGKLSVQKMLQLTAQSTVAQMLARSDFNKRFTENREISILEFIYPLLQGYDSVELKADIELGGTDQKFNLLMGRQIQEAYGQEPQVVIMTPLLEGTDGVQKMSKSLNNYIGINEAPEEIFGKVMSINDELMMRYYEILTDVALDKVRQMHPKEAKLTLGELIVAQFYDQKAAQTARKGFENTFSQGQIPEDIKDFSLKDAPKPANLTEILVRSGLAGSKNEARRLISQGSVSLDGAKIDTENWVPKPGNLKVGKRRFLRLVP